MIEHIVSNDKKCITAVVDKEKDESVIVRLEYIGSKNVWETRSDFGLTGITYTLRTDAFSEALKEYYKRIVTYLERNPQEGLFN